MPLFKNFYAKHYDLMYAAKDYGREVDFYAGLIKKYGPAGARDVLSLGAGTLNHELILARQGFAIDGIEISPEMAILAAEKIKKEKLKNIRVIRADMRSFRTDKKYDAVLSMFNVVSYCEGLAGLEAVIAGAARALDPGGVLIFDFWNAEAVEKDPPQNRWAKFEKGDTQVYRLTAPRHDFVGTRPDAVCFDLEIEIMEFQKGRCTGRERERHRVCAWRMSDIKLILKKNGLRYEAGGRFLDMKKPISADDWPAVVVAKKY